MLIALHTSCMLSNAASALHSMHAEFIGINILATATTPLSNTICLMAAPSTSPASQAHSDFCSTDAAPASKAHIDCCSETQPQQAMHTVLAAAEAVGFVEC